MPRLIFIFIFFVFCFTKTKSQTFAVIGDYGDAGQPELDVSNLVKSWQPEFIITCGDNNYPNGDSLTIDTNIGKYYHQYIFPYSGNYGDSSDTTTINRFFPALGNHDLVTANGLPYYNYFTLPNNERYYDFQWGNVHLFSINSDPSAGNEPDGVDSNSVQANWLKGKLAVSNAKWKIVYFHHSAYSSGGNHGSSSWMQWNFEQWDATAVIGGHDHIYERLQVGNIPYFVNGLGGRPAIYPLDTPLTESVKQYNANYGAMKISAFPDSIVFEFRDVSDSLIDRFVLPDSLNGVKKKLNKKNSCTVFPNPFINFAQFFLNEELGNAPLFIYDFMGNEIEKRELVNTKTVEVFIKNEGLFFYKIIQENKILATGKMISIH